MHITIPRPVVEHWQPKFDDIARHGANDSDRTYVKVMQAYDHRVVRIDADADDLREIVAECESWLGCETDVSIGANPEDRRIRSGYRRLRQVAEAAMKQSKG